MYVNIFHFSKHKFIFLFIASFGKQSIGESEVDYLFPWNSSKHQINDKKIPEEFSQSKKKKFCAD
ncbi:CLUMA_CG001061, isoform A [Clunio marinus]|uniref:CLUMA_CG001061, isoform A n=1 Tax=Clunio marinus TaxID=568069 RepID=A0A1J1HHA9_9DIPT|nr:CLUMA_CG001061, isoform A [Clunio marinus]